VKPHIGDGCQHAIEPDSACFKRGALLAFLLAMNPTSFETSTRRRRLAAFSMGLAAITGAIALSACASEVAPESDAETDSAEDALGATNSCSDCVSLQHQGDALVARNSGRPMDTPRSANAPQSAELQAIGAPPALPKKSFSEVITTCSEISKFVWEDEDQGNATGNTAFNCRDFSRWFYECMTRSGYPDVSIASVSCKNCDSGKGHGHAINVYKTPEGKWCAHEPQRPYPQNLYPDCQPTAAEARTYALNSYCKRQGNVDACCVGESTSDSTAVHRNETCRWATHVDGKWYLDCAGPAPISCNATAPEPKRPPPKPPLTACETAIRACLTSSGVACTLCRKQNIAVCNPPSGRDAGAPKVDAGGPKVDAGVAPGTIRVSFKGSATYVVTATGKVEMKGEGSRLVKLEPLPPGTYLVKWRPKVGTLGVDQESVTVISGQTTNVSAK